MGHFSELLEKAKCGDVNAVQQLLLLYKPLIESSSIYHGKAKTRF